MHLTRFVWLWQQQIVKTTTETSCNKYTLYNKNEKNTRQVGLFTGNFARRWILRKITCCPSSGYFVYDFHSALVNFLVFFQHTHNIEKTHRCTAFFFGGTSHISYFETRWALQFSLFPTFRRQLRLLLLRHYRDEIRVSLMEWSLFCLDFESELGPTFVFVSFAGW